MTRRKIYSVCALIGSLFSAPVFADQQVPVWGQAPSAQTSVDTQMTPKWTMYATAQLRKLLNGSSQNIAASIQGITHPSGNTPQLGSYNVLNLGNRMMVQIVVYWRGGVLGTTYQTSVNWELTPNQHLGAKVVGDSAMVAIAPQNQQALDNYFSQNVYPVFYSNMNAISTLWR